jgi:hypothetical protein
MRARRLGIALLVCAAVSLSGAGSAGAIPIASLTILKPHKPTLRFTARLVSPSTAATCSALARGRLQRYVGGRYINARLTRVITVNVCGTGNTGTTYAPVSGSFPTGTLPAGRYRLCLEAEQRLRSGANDYDFNCRVVFLP